MKKTGAKLGDLKIQCVLKLEEGLKGIKGSRWTKIKSQSRKNRIIQFVKPDYLIFLEQIDFE
jgi:hypothetical protein